MATDALDRLLERTKSMLLSDKLNARRALDTRPRVVPSFCQGDMVAVWRMMKGGGIPGKRAHHCVELGSCPSWKRRQSFSGTTETCATCRATCLATGGGRVANEAR